MHARRAVIWRARRVPKEIFRQHQICAPRVIRRSLALLLASGAAASAAASARMKFASKLGRAENESVAKTRLTFENKAIASLPLSPSLPQALPLSARAISSPFSCPVFCACTRSSPHGRDLGGNFKPRPRKIHVCHGWKQHFWQDIDDDTKIL